MMHGQKNIKLWRLRYFTTWLPPRHSLVAT